MFAWQKQWGTKRGSPGRFDPVKAARCGPQIRLSAVCLRRALLHCVSDPHSSVNLNQQRCEEPQTEAYSNDFHIAGKSDQSQHGGGCLEGRRGPITAEEVENRTLWRLWLAGWRVHRVLILFNRSQEGSATVFVGELEYGRCKVSPWNVIVRVARSLSQSLGEMQLPTWLIYCFKSFLMFTKQRQRDGSRTAQQI